MEPSQLNLSARKLRAGDRVAVLSPSFAGVDRSERAVSGHTWGGCLEVIDHLALADRLPSAEVSTEIARYNPDAVVCVGVPFGHTRPQWILPTAIQSNSTALLRRSPPATPDRARQKPHRGTARGIRRDGIVTPSIAT